MSNFPTSIDDDVSLPPVNDNIVEIGAEAINALREAVFNIEQELGTAPSGTAGSVSLRLAASLNPDGTIKPSAIEAMSLVTLPIYNSHIASTAAIDESKLNLDHTTQSLFNQVTDLATDVNKSLQWINLYGYKLNPHIIGSSYNHQLRDLSVDALSSNYFKNKLDAFRNNSNVYNLVKDINDELVYHQKADGYSTSSYNVETHSGYTYPSNYAHIASGIYINTSNFSTIPETATDLQQLVDFIDAASIFLYGTRIQNFYSNGVSRSSRSAVASKDGYGQNVVPETTAVTYLLNDGSNSYPTDDIDVGDDIIELKPANAVLTTNAFDAQFAQVKPGDVIRVNYGTVETQFVVKEKKYIQSGGNKKFYIRINGKNLTYTTSASVRIDKPLYNLNKYGTLALSQAHNSFSEMPSLIVGNPRSASVLGLNFNPDLIDETHYLLYLTLYPNGDLSSAVELPAIDVSGNAGITPGKYTLDSVVEAINDKFRSAGRNNRFMAFAYQGELGIMLTDPYNNTSFSIISAIVDSSGSYDQSATNSSYPNNVIDVFSIPNGIDALGFGPSNSNYASPPYSSSYSSAEQALIPTKVFVPMQRNTYYVNGTERDKFSAEIEQSLDTYGDGYWTATVQSKQTYPLPSGRVETVYRVNKDLCSSNLKEGKTLTVQSLGDGSLLDFGRFIIKTISFNDCDTANPYTDITVYDAVHGQVSSPVTTLDVGSTVAIYFGYDSLSFNDESSTDFSSVSPFKRYFELYINQDGKTFSHERARMPLSTSNMTVNSVTLYSSTNASKFDVVNVSPKLRGYVEGSLIKINLKVIEYDSTTGIYSCRLGKYNGSYSNQGPIVYGRANEVTRVYDETNNDYVDIYLSYDAGLTSFTDENVDIQLFTTLSLDEEVMLLGSCVYDVSVNKIKYLHDKRSFGNVSEKEFSSSAINYISLAEKNLHANGIVKGFDLFEDVTNPDSNEIYIKGGTALVNGKFLSLNNSTVKIPMIKERISGLIVSQEPDILWALCLNDKQELQPIPLLDGISGVTVTTNPRTFTAYNPIYGNYYKLNAISFSDLINSRKDLCLLYLVTSTVTGSGLSTSCTLSVTDARKFVIDSDSLAINKYTPSISNGNFRDVLSLLTWLKYNNKQQSQASLKGADYTFTDSVTFDYDYPTVIDGEGDCTLTFENGFVIGSNVTFKNINFVLEGEPSNSTNSDNVTFDNCTITTNLSSAQTSTSLLAFNNASNVSFNDSTIEVTHSDGLGLTTTYSALSFSICTNIQFNNTDISVTYVSSPTTDYPNNVISVSSVTNFKFNGGSISGLYNRAISMSNSIFGSNNGFHVTNATITNTYDPSLGPDLGYDTTDLVNKGHGWIYYSISSAVVDFVIENCVFNYSPATASNDRFSYITFLLSSTSSSLTGLRIQNSRFNNTTLDTDCDYRSAITILCTAASGVGTSTTINPLLRNAIIANNYLNQDQMILVSSMTGTSRALSIGLQAQSVKIDNNVCGTIGYFVTTGYRKDTFTASSTSNSLTSGLTISNNVCHYITNLNHLGEYIRISEDPSVSVDRVIASTGYVTIENNRCNWIHAGIAKIENSSLTINKNTLAGYLDSYISRFTNKVTTYPLFIDANEYDYAGVSFPTVPDGSNDSAVNVTKNIITTGFGVDAAGAITYYKTNGYLWTKSSALIKGNVFKGTDDLTTGAILLGGTNTIATNNRVYRGSANIAKYIKFYSVDDPSWDGYTSTALIVDNYFDSTTVDGSDDSIIDETRPKWIVERNINQTASMYIGIANNNLATIQDYGGYEAKFNSDDNADIDIEYGMHSATGRVTSNCLRVSDGRASPAETSISWNTTLDNILPKGVKIISLKMGIKKTNGLNDLGPGDFNFGRLTIQNYNVVGDDYTNLDTISTHATADVYFNTNIEDTVLMSTFNGSSSTEYLQVDCSSSTDEFYIGGNSPIVVGLNLHWLKTAGSAPADLKFWVSPLYIKYRW